VSTLLSSRSDPGSTSACANDDADYLRIGWVHPIGFIGIGLDGEGFTDANLTYANLKDASRRGTNLGGANFKDANTADVHGLESRPLNTLHGRAALNTSKCGGLT
jgi:uncharacterized protein YjbI with pentapeptide repeats